MVMIVHTDIEGFCLAMFHLHGLLDMAAVLGTMICTVIMDTGHTTTIIAITMAI